MALVVYKKVKETIDGTKQELTGGLEEGTLTASGIEAALDQTEQTIVSVVEEHVEKEREAVRDEERGRLQDLREEQQREALIDETRADIEDVYLVRYRNTTIQVGRKAYEKLKDTYLDQMRTNADGEEVEWDVVEEEPENDVDQNLDYEAAIVVHDNLDNVDVLRLWRPVLVISESVPDLERLWGLHNASRQKVQEYIAEHIDSIEELDAFLKLLQEYDWTEYYWQLGVQRAFIQPVMTVVERQNRKRKREAETGSAAPSETKRAHHLDGAD